MSASLLAAATAPAPPAPRTGLRPAPRTDPPYDDELGHPEGLVTRRSAATRWQSRCPASMARSGRRPCPPRCACHSPSQPRETLHRAAVHRLPARAQ